jgi:S-methylmethionine-dependent homocysteine/selenocysteine methylase
MTDSLEQLETRLLSKNVVLLDGAFGTELTRRRAKTPLPLWSASAIVTDPALCQQIHQDYIEAGADIITTNTFRTNVRTCQRSGSTADFETLTSLACAQANAARAATGRPDVLIAGCIAPVEDCYVPDLVPSNKELNSEHGALAEVLSESQVDIIFCETFNSIREAEIALSSASDTGLPVAISFVCSPDGLLLSGESLSVACTMAMEFSPLFIAVNCAPPELIHHSLKKLLEATTIPTGVYANGIGRPSEDCSWIYPAGGTPERTYLQHAKEWYEAGALVIGGCCGTTAPYIKALADYFHSLGSETASD